MSSKFTSNKFFFFDIKKLHLEFFVKKKKKKKLQEHEEIQMKNTSPVKNLKKCLL